MKDDVKQLEKRIEGFKKSFISNIVSHFRKQYNISLESGEIKDRYKDTNGITYNDIVNEVFEQLGGFNFKEKAVNEIKENIRKTIYRDDKIKIAKGKLTINDFVRWESWDSYCRIGWDDRKVNPLFMALSHFDTEQAEEMEFYYESVRNELEEGQRKYDIFRKYELGYNKVKSIRIYKNGKIEIEFQTNEQAQQFKNEYLTR